MTAGPPRQGARSSRGARLRHRQRVPLTVLSTDVAGRSMMAALPLHRLDPRLVNGAGLVEIAVFAVLLIHPSVVTLGLFAVAAVVFAGLHLSDSRAVLGLQSDGEATLLTARRDGRPVAVRMSMPGPPVLPIPSGFAVSLRVASVRWWIDRVAFPLLAEARAATPPP